MKADASVYEGKRVIRGALSDLPALATQLGDGPALLIIGEAIAQARAIAAAVAA